MAELSGITENRKLVSYYRWSSYIDNLKTEAEKAPLIKNEFEAAEKIAKAFEAAVKKRIPKGKFGIFFSGGVDSTMIAVLCKKVTDEFNCYTVGIEGSKDLEESSRAAGHFKLKHVKKKLTIKETERLFEETAGILGKELINIVNLGVGSVVMAAAKLAEKDGLRIMFSGLGSEEIFAGYQRHENAADINEECWHGLKTTWERDFQRDYNIASAKKITVLTPFLDKNVILAAMATDDKLKLRDGHKKYILRKAAESLGMPHEFAFRPKLAAQYGSSFDKAIMKIAKEKGFKFKKEYLEYLSRIS